MSIWDTFDEEAGENELSGSSSANTTPPTIAQVAMFESFLSGKCHDGNDKSTRKPFSFSQCLRVATYKGEGQAYWEAVLQFAKHRYTGTKQLDNGNRVSTWSVLKAMVIRNGELPVEKRDRLNGLESAMLQAFQLQKTQQTEARFAESAASTAIAGGGKGSSNSASDDKAAGGDE